MTGACGTTQSWQTIEERTKKGHERERGRDGSKLCHLPVVFNYTPQWDQQSRHLTTRDKQANKRKSKGLARDLNKRLKELLYNKQVIKYMKSA